ncbi:hypothetical protein [Hahella ganghwensis]|uniref:hypothetical protein n=1 Tax=Hahella ganghwensis TaxID=286420 RepID=UPI0003674096|nr:hypothetical protein [Hahella ganghwensis]
MISQFERWVVAFFAVFGAFVFCGVGGFLIASLFGVWGLPVAGFFAAFSVVVLTYISAPKYQLPLVSIVFLVGCVLAWIILKDGHYPESYSEKAYQQTYLPFLATILGGMISVAFAFFLHKGPTTMMKEEG